jgi:hypothetical protein
MVVTKSDSAQGGAHKTVESAIAAKQISHPNSLCFAVPMSCVGGLIGRGGQTLRDLHIEYAVRVYIEKEEFTGQRIVVLSYTGLAAAAPESEGAEGADEDESGVEPMVDESGDLGASGNKRKRGQERTAEEVVEANLALGLCKERIEGMVQDLLKEQKPAPEADPSA